jgi:plastocyanin
MTTTKPRLLFVEGLTIGLLLACTATASAPAAPPTTTVGVEATGVVTTLTPIPATVAPAPGFTPEVSQRDTAGVPLPSAPGARSVVVTYTPVPGGVQVKSGVVTVSIGDNYFDPDELHVTVASTVEWRYDGAGGETESTHTVTALDKSFTSGDLQPGARFSFTFKQPGEFAYVCSYHTKQMTAKIFVQ